MAERVLVTGGSGFIGGHCVLALVAAGYEVRATIRSLAREASARDRLRAAGLPDDAPLTFVAAELTSDEGRADALAGCDGVLHVASLVRLEPVADENEMISPARDGASRVLKAARAAGVKRVVLTSAFRSRSRSGRSARAD